MGEYPVVKGWRVSVVAQQLNPPCEIPGLPMEEPGSGLGSSASEPASCWCGREGSDDGPSSWVLSPTWEARMDLGAPNLVVTFAEWSSQWSSTCREQHPFYLPKFLGAALPIMPQSLCQIQLVMELSKPLFTLGTNSGRKINLKGWRTLALWHNVLMWKMEGLQREYMQRL